MTTTGIFTIHQFNIPYSKYNEPIYLIPFGDVHRSAPLCHEDKWLEFIEWAKTKKNAYFIGMGDYDDLESASERAILTDRKIHDTTKQTLEKLYRTHTERLAKELSFMKGRVIGFIEGNHYTEFPNGTTSTQYLCQLLGDAKYLGVSSFIRLTFDSKTKRDCRKSIDIFAHHGKGAARLIGGSLNRVQQMVEAAEADIYLMGHDHKKSIGLITRLRLANGGESLKLRHKKVLMARTGSFLKGYEDNKVSYVADMGLSPTDLGVIKIELTPRRDLKGNQDYTYIDIHASL